MISKQNWLVCNPFEGVSKICRRKLNLLSESSLQWLYKKNVPWQSDFHKNVLFIQKIKWSRRNNDHKSSNKNHEDIKYNKIKRSLIWMHWFLYILLLVVVEIDFYNAIVSDILNLVRIYNKCIFEKLLT